MLAAVIIYLSILLLISLTDFFKAKSFEQFSVAGKNQNAFTVFLTLFATAIGASTTFGIAERTASVGQSSIWFLAAGSFGLLMQALILSSKIRTLDANTLPELAEKTIGKTNALFISVIIFVSWTGIVAAQFVALAKIFSALFSAEYKTVLVIVGALVILYTMLGGQMAVVKTDRVQAFLIFAGIAAAFVYCFTHLADLLPVAQEGAALQTAAAVAQEGITLQTAAAVAQEDAVLQTVAAFAQQGASFADSAAIASQKFFDFTKNISAVELLELFFVTGGTFFLGPDIISRNLISKNAVTAKRAAIAGSLVLLVFAFLTVETSFFAVKLSSVAQEGAGLQTVAAVAQDGASFADSAAVAQEVTALQTANSIAQEGTTLQNTAAVAQNPLVWLTTNYLPLPLAIILCIALISALFSSVDTCLVNAATIFEYNVLRRKSVFQIRILILLMGICALIISLFNQRIMTLLLGAYSIYSPGIVPPLTVGILCYGKRDLDKRLLLAAVVCGSACGILGQVVSGAVSLSLCGMAVSGVLTVMAAVRGQAAVSTRSAG